jgi:prophage antirepressor-like protein
MSYLNKFAGNRGIEVIKQHGLYYYNGQEVCAVLGFGNNRDVINRHTLPRERTTIKTLGGRNTVFVDDSGFLALFFASRVVPDELKGNIRDELLMTHTKKVTKTDTNEGIFYLDDLANRNGIETLEQWGLRFYNGLQVCKYLGYVNSRVAIKRHTLEREITLNKSYSKRGTTFVDESGFLALIFQSKNVSDEMKGNIRVELLNAFTEWLTNQ